MTVQKVNTVIIGAGLTGLSCASFRKDVNEDFVVLEKTDRVGGAIRTYNNGSFIYEAGPNTGVLSSTEAVELFDKLTGLCETEIGNKAASKRYILKDGEWNAIPSSLGGAITTPLFTLKDKFRILGEPFRAKGTDPNESLANLVRRRMGESFLNYAVDPFVAGIYAGDPELLIPKYALPKLFNLEQNYGSFVKGSIKKSKEPKTDAEKRVTKEVFSVKGGLESLIVAMHSYIGHDKVKLNCADIKIQPIDNQFEVTYNHGEKIIANKVITTVGAFEIPEMIDFVAKDTIADINNVEYAGMVEVSLGFDNWEGIPLDGFGGLISSLEKRDILGILFCSSFLNNRAPKNGAQLSCFTGGLRIPQMYKKTDAEITEIVAREVTDLCKLKDFKPDLIHIHRYKYAIPQYYANTEQRIIAIEKVEKQFPGLFIGGNLINGIGMSDRIKQGKRLSLK